MMTTPTLLTATAAAVAGLLLATIPQAEARGQGVRTTFQTGAGTTSPAKTGRVIVRDHRKGEVWARACRNRECPYYPPR